MSKELEFVEGRFFSMATHQKFNGSSAKVGEFLTRLRKAFPVPITFVFRDLEAGDKVAFVLNQGGTGGTRVTVNTNRADFKLKDFKAFLPALTLLPNAAH